jgi:hypothetical protein
MDWHYHGRAIRMLDENVAAALSDDRETSTLQSANQLGPGNDR